MNRLAVVAGIGILTALYVGYLFGSYDPTVKKQPTELDGRITESDTKVIIALEKIAANGYTRTSLSKNMVPVYRWVRNLESSSVCSFSVYEDDRPRSDVHWCRRARNATSAIWDNEREAEKVQIIKDYEASLLEGNTNTNVGQ